jgi:hypothetical protein
MDDTTGTSSDEESDDGGDKLDVDDTDLPGEVPSCKVVGDDMDGTGACDDVAPPASFTPDVQWTWAGTNENQVVANPVVANLTDDNEDGEIDLCDIPDIVVIAYEGDSHYNPDGRLGHIYVLDGETGQLHFMIDQIVDHDCPPAVGDIDGDGLPEILAHARMQGGNFPGALVAFEHDGTLKWMGDQPINGSRQWPIGLADLDADGDTEIYIGDRVYDHQGTELWAKPGIVSGLQTTTAADLDEDGDMEVVFGYDAWEHDGSVYFHFEPDDLDWPHPAVADLDDDGMAEVLLVERDGMTILEHDGTEKVVFPTSLAANRPPAIHDMDGDEAPEIAVGADPSYSVFEADLTEVWTVPVVDGSGNASGTAFDFLGDATAEAMYADETTLFIFGEGGEELLTAPRTSWTAIETPVVADVDNDGSAEIVVISNKGYIDGDTPPVQVIRDAEDRWIQARRIWNQHTYHVTNVREDGTIPQEEPRHWELLNTYRTQAQISKDGVCKPVPEG